MNTQQSNKESITNPNTKNITLVDGFKRGDGIVKKITLVKPNTGHCRGLSLKAVLNFEIDALATLLPRITIPAMTSDDVYKLELMDTLKIAEGITHFLEAANESPTA